MREPKITMVQCVNALCMPNDVIDSCGDYDISTHYSSELYRVEDNGSVLSEWLKSIGFKFEDDYTWLGVWGT